MVKGEGRREKEGRRKRRMARRRVWMERRENMCRRSRGVVKGREFAEQVEKGVSRVLKEI